MEKVSKYKAVDGREFSNEKECMDYEILIEKVNSIMSVLKPLPKDDGCDFANGHYFVQQSKSNFNAAKIALLHLIKKYITHKWVEQTIESETIHLSYVGRLIDDYNIRPLNSAWNRLMCIDKEYREWGQPYFTNNPEESPALKKENATN